MFADCGAEVRECAAGAEVAGTVDARAGDEQRDVFACVIGGDVGRIAAMIGRDEQKIVVVQDLDKPRVVGSCLSNQQRDRPGTR